jgi:hypothetical protein
MLLGHGQTERDDFVDSGGGGGYIDLQRRLHPGYDGVT